MILGLILSCEVAFWIFIAAGLTFRYLLKAPKTGLLLLGCTPLIDLILLAATAADLHNGAKAGFAHGLAAVYIGVSIAFGRRMIRWADIRFAHRFGGGPAPTKKPRYGKAHAREELQAWLLHLFAWAVGCALLYGIVFWIRDAERTENLLKVIRLWSIVLGIDFLISCSYTLWPRTPKPDRRETPGTK